MAKIDILDPKWVDMVFANKNREYGAYQLRKGTSSRNLLALVILMTVALLIGGYLFYKVKADEAAERERLEAMKRSAELSAEAEQQEEEELQEDAPPPPPPQDVPEVEQVRETQQFVVPEIKEVIDEAKEVKSTTDLDAETAIGAKDQEGTSDASVLTEAVKEVQEPVKEPEPEKPPVVEDTKVYNLAELAEQPSFPGGDAAMYQWLSKNLQYPPIAQENGISGTVVVQFVVEKDGSVNGVKVVRGKDPSLDKEAVRVVSKMPKWNPGKQNGQHVRVWYTLPVKFQLQ